MQPLHTSRDFGRTDIERRKQHVPDPYEHAPDTTASAPEPAEPDIIMQLVEIPHAVWAMQRELHAIYEQYMLAAAPRPWAPLATLSNAAGTVLGAQSWAAAITRLTRDIGIELEDMVIGTDAAHTVQLLAVPNEVLDATIPTRLLGTVRTTATALTTAFPGRAVLRNGESLILLATDSAAAHFDFSCRYRVLRS